MARQVNSDINWSSIQGDYPIAGKDNDSQGFRDNFSLIKNNFQTAKTEIEDLLANTIRNDLIADFNDQDIINANLVSYSEKEQDLGIYTNNNNSPTFDVTIDFKLAPYQKLKIAGQNIRLKLTNFPAGGKLGKVRIELTCDGTPRNITFTSDIISPTYYKSSSVPSTITISSSTVPVIIDVWTYDQGSTVFIDYTQYAPFTV